MTCLSVLSGSSGSILMMDGRWMMASILVKRVILFHHARLTLFLILPLHVKARLCDLVAMLLALSLMTSSEPALPTT
ncbi:hypothetical protein GQ55_3G059200 [Panicum hallii var. hallii]|uniref:Uncharacterized protein n=1 Tax=Panicum hallii var. hallii TaxID=1504633 RepID=A0A2T7E662_9POAL|nr:hypothetical protein GQ55_3G059200 [Panicum hallii var. hallii]PUZ63327.1 hypothetical protein GQ55_3G059200 [Panicum hallii var. hallii]